MLPTSMAAGAPAAVWFSDGEVRQQLQDLGYDNVAPDVFEAFLFGVFVGVTFCVGCVGSLVA